MSSQIPPITLKWFNKLIEEHFGEFPDWVNKEKFDKHLLDSLNEELNESFGNDRDYIDLSNFWVQLVSCCMNINMGDYDIEEDIPYYVYKEQLILRNLPLDKLNEIFNVEYEES